MEVKTISSEITSRIVNEQDLLNVYNISLDEWEIEKKIINTWESGAKNDKGEIVTTPLFQVKLWLRSKQEIKDLEQIRQEFIEDIKKLSPVVKAKHAQNIAKDPVVVEIDIFDFHFGKLAWEIETGSSYDTKIATKIFNECIDYFIENTKHLNIEKFLLPIGNDYYNSDGAHPYNHTTKGTPQESDTRWQDTFRKGRQLLVENITKLTHIAPVDVVLICGNHDTERTFYLGDSLEGWFYNNENVKIDNGPSPRKYYQYGVNLLGFTHGDAEKLSSLPMLMTHEAPMEWAITKNREFHVGHLHHKKEFNFQPTRETNGVMIRFMSSLSATDAWHNLRGYKGSRRAAECYVWDKQRGNTQILNYII
jgi:hypothetical protein